MSYKELSEEDKLEEAIRFIAVGQPLPEALESFLREAGLHEAVIKHRRERCQS